MSVTVSEVLVAARSGLAAVSSETAGYLVLGAADCLGDAPVGIAGVYLDEDGALRVDRRAASVPGDGEPGLRAILRKLLETGRSPAPALLRVASARETRGIRRLITEIEAALIPVNRAAARRALARLHRDVLRGKTAGKVAASADELVLLEPSILPPKAVPAPVVEKASTEGPTPVVPDVEPIPSVAVVEPPEVPSPEPLEPSPALWVEYAPEGTPVLGSVVTAPREEPAKELLADLELDAPDTDRAPPVALDAPTPRSGAETAIIGSYGMAGEVQRLEPEVDEGEPEFELHVGEPELEEPEFELRAPEPFEPVFAREAAVEIDEPARAEEREARDALEAALLDIEQSEEPPPMESAEPSSELFVPMFDLVHESLPDEAPGEGDAPHQDEHTLSTRPVEEPDESIECLIDEALAMAPEAIAAARLPVAPSARSLLPRFSAIRYESGTAPGLGFVNIAFVAADFDVAPPVALEPGDGESPSAEPPSIEQALTRLPLVEPLDELPSVEPPEAEVASLEPPKAEVESVEPPMAEIPSLVPPAVALRSLAPPVTELESVEPPVTELESVEPPVAELESVVPPVTELESVERPVEFSIVEPSVVEFGAVSDAIEFDVFEPAIAEFGANEHWVDDPVIDEVATSDEPAIDEVATAEEPAIEAATAASEPAIAEARVNEPRFAMLEDEPLAVVPDVAEPSYHPKRSDVADLVAAFVVAESRTLSELSRELKRMAGIAATPAAPEVAPAPSRRKVSSAR